MKRLKAITGSASQASIFLLLRQKILYCILIDHSGNKDNIYAETDLPCTPKSTQNDIFTLQAQTTVAHSCTLAHMHALPKQKHETWRNTKHKNTVEHSGGPVPSSRIHAYMPPYTLPKHLPPYTYLQKLSPMKITNTQPNQSAIDQSRLRWDFQKQGNRPAIELIAG